MIKAAKNIRDVVLNNSLVASILKSGGSSDDCIIAMHNQIQEMIKERKMKTRKSTSKSGGQRRLPQAVSDEKAASEMKRLANAISRGFSI